ncbi:MAG: hypothetical protein Q8L10_01855 [Candidatus Moranbacteria bacterium]|nr:hypothetical protein [Candidatus Moranbacteria bacterium]
MLSKKNGFNSNVTFERISSLTKYQVTKKIGVRRNELALSEAIELAQDITEYQNQLQSVGIPIPPIDELDIKYFPENGKASITLLTPWAGEDVESVILSLDTERDKKTIEWIIKEMCRITLLACTKRTRNGELSVGIDAKTNNFTVAIDNSGRRTMSYVDQYPPHYWKNGVPLLEWVPLKSALGKELNQFKYFDWRGVFLTLTSQLCRISPLLKKQVEEIAIDEFKKCFTKSEFKEFHNQFAELPWITFRNMLSKNKLTQAKQLIMRCVHEKVFGVRYSIYTLREIALELAMRQLISLDELHKLFFDLYFEDAEFMPDKWKGTQERLCQFVRRPLP